MSNLLETKVNTLFGFWTQPRDQKLSLNIQKETCEHDCHSPRKAASNHCVCILFLGTSAVSNPIPSCGRVILKSFASRLAPEMGPGPWQLLLWQNDSFVWHRMTHAHNQSIPLLLQASHITFVEHWDRQSLILKKHHCGVVLIFAHSAAWDYKCEVICIFIFSILL